jgi:hypothetical protein
LIVAQKTSELIIFSTGILSPVNIDSSILDLPLIIFPSRGIFSQGNTFIVSHIFISSIFLRIISSQLMTCACFAHNSINLEIASQAVFLDFDSKNFHKFISVIIATAASKYTCSLGINIIQNE